MDPLTHAASGAVAMLALPRRPATRWAVPLAALVAAFPDIDIAFVRGPLQFLQLHRGFTHTLFYLPLLALLLALAARPLWKRDTPGRWPLPLVWLFFGGLILLHIWLDCITTYGTMIFLPFSAERVRLNGVFIIDLLLTLPLLAAVWFALRRSAVRPARLALCWLALYPCCAIGLNSHLAAAYRAELTGQGREIERLVVLPDAFSPVFWRALYEERQSNGLVVRADGLTALGRAHERGFPRPALRPELAASLREQSAICRDFLDFSLLPLTLPVPKNLRPADAVSAPDEQAAAAAQPQALRGYLEISDERFGSSLRFVRWIMRRRAGEGGSPFRLFVELGYASDAVPRLLRERLYLPDSGRDSGWQPPRPPRPAQGLDWWLGLC